MQQDTVSEVMRRMEFLLLHPFNGGRIVIIETDDGNLEKMAQTGLVSTLGTKETAENLRRLRNEAGRSWPVIIRTPEDFEKLDERFLHELTEEIMRFGQLMVFVAPFGGWKSWVSKLTNLGAIGLHDCSLLLRVSTADVSCVHH